MSESGSNNLSEDSLSSNNVINNRQLSLLPTSESNNTVAPQERGDNLHSPRNLQDLLNISTSLQTGSDPSSIRPAEPIDVERQQFLKNVIASLSVDVVEYIKQRVLTLQGFLTKPDSNISKYEETLEELMDQVDSIDMANVFYQVGGLEVISPLLACEHSSLRSKAADTIAICCQNNPFCQKLSSEDKIIDSLIQVAVTDGNLTAKLKAIAALSAIIRDNPEGITSFRKHNGFEVVYEALGSANEKIVAKTSYLIMALCDTDEKSRDDLLKLGVVESLVSLSRLTENLLVEHFLRALESLTRDHVPSQLECLRKELMLNDYLASLLVQKASDEAYIEIREVAQELLKRMNDVSTKFEVSTSVLRQGNKSQLEQLFEKSRISVP